VNLHHNTTTKILYEQRPSEAWIPSYGPMKIKEDQSVHPEFPWKHCRRQTSGTLLSSTMSDWGCLSQFPTKCPSRAVVRCGSVEWGSLIVHPLWCSTTFMVLHHILWSMHYGASPHLWSIHYGAPPHLWSVHFGALTHVWFMHYGAPPHMWFMHYGAPPHMVHALWCSTTLSFCSSAIREHPVSVPMESMTWNNNMDRPFT